MSHFSRMTRDEVLRRLREARAGMDSRVAAIPDERLDRPIGDGGHTPKEIVFHVMSYDELIVERLRAAHEGEVTAFDRDRVSWESFNDRIWAEARAADVGETIARASRVFEELVHEVEQLNDEELNEPVGIAAQLDPAWLQGRSLAELIAIDAFEHYPMHYAALETAAS